MFKRLLKSKEVGKRLYKSYHVEEAGNVRWEGPYKLRSYGK
ncbi:MAG: hypothetical protein QXQ86_01810 [Sulfolobales archaeon]